MINVSQTIKNSCKADKNTHTEYIIINGQTIYIKGKLNATAYKDTTFFGTFNMKVLEFETENTTQFRNRQFEYYKVIDGNAFKVGTFITTEVVDNDSKDSIKVTANDYALKFAVPYTSELDYSSGNITLYDVLKECCNQVGVELENKFIDNNSFKVDSNQFVNGELVGDVICAIAGISGNFATITNEDKLRLTFTNGTGAEQTTTIDGSTQINASGFKDIELLAKTTQNTTTGKNLLPNDLETKTINGITITKNNDGTYKVNGTATADISLAINNDFVSMSGTWRMLGCPSGGSSTTYMLSAYVGYWGGGSPNIDTGSGTNITYTGNVKVRFYIKSGTTCNNLIFKPMLTTDTSTAINNWERYTYGASPNPNYPQNIETTTGRNTINIIGKNYANIENIQIGKGWANTTQVQRATILYIPVKLNQEYTLVSSWTNSHITNIRAVFNHGESDKTNNAVPPSYPYNNTQWEYASIEILANTTFTSDMLDGVKIMLCEGSAAINDYEPYIGNSYEINLGSLELCKIENYQDKLFKTSGKNIIQTIDIYSGYANRNIGSTISYSSSANSITYKKCAYVEANETYTISWDYDTPKAVASRDIIICNNNSIELEYIAYSNSNTKMATFTPTNSGWVYAVLDTNAINVMIEKGNTATTYEPYGNYWYKYNAIGKVVLNGSESGWMTQQQTGFYRYGLNISNINNNSSLANQILIMANQFRGITFNARGNDINETIYVVNNGQQNQFFVNTKLFDTIANFKTHLNSNNLIIYYVLATPTYTKIENDELIGQLDSIKTLDLFDGINNITTNAPFFLTYLDDNIELLEDYTDLDDKRDTQPITSVSIGASQVEGQEAILRDENLIAQYGEHWLVINDNPFGYTLEKRQQLVKAIFDKVKGFGYSSFKSEYSYRPYLELGDKIKFKNKNGDLINSAILRYNFDFDNCTFEAPSITSATIDYELSPDANELAKRAEIIANQADASITAITQGLQIDEDGNSQVIESIKTTQKQNSLDIEAITSYEEIDGKQVLTGVKTKTGFTFNSQGLIIESSKNTYKAVHNETGDYYYDGDTPLGETTNEGSKFKNMDLYGEFRYGKDDIDDPALFVSMKYEETNNNVEEECFGHFWNGD